MLGWVAAIAAKPLIDSLSTATLVLIAAGGLLYSAGIIFYFWHSLRFQNAIWHAFVAAAAACHMRLLLAALRALERKVCSHPDYTSKWNLAYGRCLPRADQRLVADEIQGKARQDRARRS